MALNRTSGRRTRGGTSLTSGSGVPADVLRKGPTAALAWKQANAGSVGKSSGQAAIEKAFAAMDKSKGRDFGTPTHDYHYTKDGVARVHRTTGEVTNMSTEAGNADFEARKVRSGSRKGSVGAKAGSVTPSSKGGKAPIEGRFFVFDEKLRGHLEGQSRGTGYTVHDGTSGVVLHAKTRNEAQKAADRLNIADKAKPVTRRSEVKEALKPARAAQASGLDRPAPSPKTTSGLHGTQNKANADAIKANRKAKAAPGQAARDEISADRRARVQAASDKAARAAQERSLTPYQQVKAEAGQREAAFKGAVGPKVTEGNTPAVRAARRERMANAVADQRNAQFMRGGKEAPTSMTHVPTAERTVSLTPKSEPWSGMTDYAERAAIAPRVSPSAVTPAIAPKPSWGMRGLGMAGKALPWVAGAAAAGAGLFAFSRAAKAGESNLQAAGEGVKEAAKVGVPGVAAVSDAMATLKQTGNPFRAALTGSESMGTHIPGAALVGMGIAGAAIGGARLVVQGAAKGFDAANAAYHNAHMTGHTAESEPSTADPNHKKGWSNQARIASAVKRGAKTLPYASAPTEKGD